jgi:DNA-binding beta-propeller fold protein YncE
MKVVVLKLPDGSADAQTLWTIPDRVRYLWMLADGRFLLRDRDGLQAGDADLKTEPFAPLPGQFLSLQTDPSQKTVVVSSVEPPSTDATTCVIDAQTGKVRQTTRARTSPELPINEDGFLETAHEKYDQWSLKLTAFDGTQKILGHIASNCAPSASFIAAQQILITGCNQRHIPMLTAVSTDGKTLWQSEIPLTYLPPLQLNAANGSRFIRESIVFKKAPSSGNDTLWVKAVQGQVVQVYDSATGKPLLELPVSPVLDAGGNVAISPSGKHVAVLNNGSIQVYDLPAN